MKSKKIIASLMTLSIVASSGVIFNSVQAAGIDVGTNMQKIAYAQKSLKSNSTNYSVYSSLSYKAIEDIIVYKFSTARELANYMINKGYINERVAYNTAVAIMRCERNDAIVEEIDLANGILVLKASDSNEYTIVPDHALNTPTYPTYTPYFYLSETQVHTIRDYMNKPTYGGSSSKFRDFLVNSNICNDSTKAYYVALALREHTGTGLERINNGGIQIFKSNSSVWKFMTAQVPEYIAN